jgi:hypothetical protein
MPARKLGPLLACLFLGACGFEGAQLASEVQNQMIGLTKEQVLACMGPPLNKAAGGSTEVWSYASRDEWRDPTLKVARGWWGEPSSQKSCTIKLVMVAGRVNRLSYVGATGGPLAPGEQCVFALENCVRSAAQ